MDPAVGFLDPLKNLCNIDSARVYDLSSIMGVGTAKIVQVKAAFELPPSTT